MRVRLSDTELANIRFLADSKGMNVSELVRHLADIHLSAKEWVRVLRQQSLEYEERVRRFWEQNSIDVGADDDVSNHF